MAQVSLAKGERRRSRMRNFNWETIPKHSVIGRHNIWTADKTDEEYELDTDHMEELFSHKQVQKQLKAASRQSLRGLPAAASGGEIVSVLSSKRSMNIGIFLKQFKRPVMDMIEDIKAGNGLSFGPGKLRELCKLLPEEGEVKQLMAFKGEQSALPDADLFMLMLVNIPSFEERLNSLVLKEELFPLMNEMSGFVATLKAAGEELLNSDHLHSILRLVLKTGNYMNAGGYAGSAVGFRMKSLLKLVDTKANKPGMNLMHYVVMQAQNVDMTVLTFPDQLVHIEAAARIHKCDIEAEFDRQVKKVRDAKADTAKQEDLKAQMEDFLKEAEVCLSEVQAELEELQAVSDSVAEYFCEEPGKFKLEECCAIFHSFCERFMRAMQENKAREVAEVKRRHRDRLQCAAKRRSTATCSSRDKEMEGVALESVLQNFLTSRTSRRRSGRPSSANGSPVSGSPKNGSLTEITSQANLPAANQKRVGPFRTKDFGGKEWNSSVELTEVSSEIKTPANTMDNKRKAENAKESETPSKEEPRVVPLPSSRTPSISSPSRSFSISTEGDEEDLQDNTEAEAQTLREASKKVLRFQNSRGSVSSAEFSLENQKSPGKSGRVLPRQRTFDEETLRYAGDPTNDDLVQFLLSPQPSSKRNLSRRHTLPVKVPKTGEEEDDVMVLLSARTPISAARDAGGHPVEDAGHKSKQVFEYPDISDDLTNPVAPSAEKKSKLNSSPTHAQDDRSVEQKQEGTSSEAAGNRQEPNGGSVPPKTAWIKTETTGLFLSFFKRLGDMGKVQNSKESVEKGSGV